MSHEAIANICPEETLLFRFYFNQLFCLFILYLAICAFSLDLRDLKSRPGKAWNILLCHLPHCVDPPPGAPPTHQDPAGCSHKLLSDLISAKEKGSRISLGAGKALESAIRLNVSPLSAAGSSTNIPEAAEPDMHA